MIDKSHPVGKLANFRDLGQLRGDYGTTKSGMVFRSDDLAQLDEKEIERVLATGLSLVIDLRSKDEVEGAGRGLFEESGVEYLNLPLLSPETSGIQTQELLDFDFSNQMLGQWYAKVFSEALANINRGLEVISAADGPVLFHCAIGKDRTGIFAASLLSVLGIQREEIVRDYTLTNRNIGQVLSRLTNLHPFWTEELIVKSGALMRADTEAIQEMLEIVGSSEGIYSSLTAAGLEPSAVDRLRDRLLEA
jgi:protein-tyrosine phosphatase